MRTLRRVRALQIIGIVCPLEADVGIEVFLDLLTQRENLILSPIDFQASSKERVRRVQHVLSSILGC
jgi:hypothetical protein